jgi:beta-lactamase regulating signal transducer with metallopeptidase domain
MNFMPLFDHLWQSTLFAVVAGLLTLALRKNRARVRHGLWLAASAKFLLPLSALIVLGSRIPGPKPPQPASAVVSFMVAVSEPFTVPPAVTPPALPVRPTTNFLPPILAGIWACGFLGIVCSWWIRWRRIAAVVRAGSPADLQLPIPVVVSPARVEPGVFGIVHPILMLPASIFERLTPEQLNAVIAHELEHVQHRDNLVAAFHMFVEAVFWFHPLLWWIGKRMLEERERACDESVLSTGSKPRVYAEAVISVCKLYVESPLGCVSGITGANLKRRIEVIMTQRIASDLHFTKKLGLAIVGLAVLTTPIFIGMMHSPAVRAQSPAGAIAQPVTAPAAASDAPPVATAPPQKPHPRAIPATAIAPLAVEQAVAQPEPQISPGTAPAEAQKIRAAYAKANFQNPAMVAAYTSYGPPNSKTRTADAEIWRYDYLDLYKSNLIVEFPPSVRFAANVKWPLPATFEGRAPEEPAGAASLVSALNLSGANEPPELKLPGRHASIQPSLRINRAEQFVNLAAPMDTMTGRIDIVGNITDEYGMVVANVRDTADAKMVTWQAAFVLLPGSYVCKVLLREQATGLMYTESIPFQLTR